MTNADPVSTGGGPSSVESMTEEEIIRIATADFNMVGRMNDQADAWSKAEELARHSEEVIRTKREAHLEGHSVALSFVKRQLVLMEEGAQKAADTAGSNATAMREHALEAERLYEEVKKLEGDAATMDGMTEEEREEEFGSQAGAGADTFAQYRQSVLEDMRAEMSTAEDTHRTTFSSYAGKPPEYEGLSAWTGGMPEDPPGTRPQLGPASLYGGEAPSGSGYPGGSGSPGGPGSGGSTTIPSPPPTSDGPQLQNPGTPGQAPVNPAPGPGTAPPPGGGGGGGFAPPPPMTGGGAVPGGARPATPPAIRPGGGGVPPSGARSTPGLNPGNRPAGAGTGSRPPMANAPGRGGTGGAHPGGTRPGAGGGRGGASKADRAMLPNQRNTAGNAAGRGPAGNAAGRGPAGNAAGNGARPSGTAGGRTAASTGNSAFNSTRRSVPSVIGQRGAANAGDNAQPRPPATPRASGRVAFGERANKGAQSTAKGGGAIRRDTLSKHGIVTNRPGMRQYTNDPTPRSGGLQQGKVFGERASKQPELSTVEKRRRQRRESLSTKRREILDSFRTRKALEADHPVAEGLGSNVVPPVVKSQPQRSQVSRQDVGPVFGARGWENNS